MYGYCFLLSSTIKSLIRQKVWRPIRRAFYDRHCDMERVADDIWRCTRCKRESDIFTHRRCLKQVELLYLGDVVEAIIIVLGQTTYGNCGCKKRKQWLNRWSRAIHERLFTPRKESP